MSLSTWYLHVHVVVPTSSYVVLVQLYVLEAVPYRYRGDTIAVRRAGCAWWLAGWLAGWTERERNHDAVKRCERGQRHSQPPPGRGAGGTACRIRQMLTRQIFSYGLFRRQVISAMRVGLTLEHCFRYFSNGSSRITARRMDIKPSKRRSCRPQFTQ